jgi:hypothetical protein
MSAIFDEGGARGLLMNNLCVYHGTSLVFDSSAVHTGDDSGDVGVNDVDGDGDDAVAKADAAAAFDSVSALAAAAEDGNCDIGGLEKLLTTNLTTPSQTKNSRKSKSNGVSGLRALSVCPLLDRFVAMFKEPLDGDIDVDGDGGAGDGGGLASYRDNGGDDDDTDDEGDHYSHLGGDDGNESGFASISTMYGSGGGDFSLGR